MIVLDFETRSTCNLKSAGAWMYAKDPTTSILCLAYAQADNDETPQLWHWRQDSTESLADLFSAIERGDLIEAHNVFFERSIWENIAVARHGWPEIRPDQWRCTAARAAAAGLPRSLDQVAKVLDLDVKKDEDGRRVMMKCARPRKPSKHDKSVWNENPDDLATLYAYCVTDVVVERLVSRTIPELTPKELKIWQLDQAINHRGVKVDRRAIESTIALLDRAAADANAALEELTDGAVTALTQTVKLTNWLGPRGYPFTSLAADNVDAWLKSDIENHEVRTALELRQAVSKSSTAKYKKMLERVDDDDRIRGNLVYAGAARTGRWSASGVQFQNQPRGEFNDTLDLLVDTLIGGDGDLVEMLFDTVHGAAASAIRSMLIADEGHRLIVCDFAAIEARVLAWLADNYRMLELFATGADAYVDLAVDIYNVKGGADNVTKDQRFVGKTCVLGLGYQMGALKLRGTMDGYGFPITEDFADLCVSTFRDRNPEYPSLWKSLENAALRAVKSPGKRFTVRKKITFEQRKAILYIGLPSGRELSYIRPKITKRETRWGVKSQLEYMGQNSQTRKWERQNTYGGKIAENVTQAVARDLMAESMLALEAAGYKNILTIHDEAIVEAPDGFGSLEEVSAIMQTAPPWAAGCPIGAEGFEATRYRKD